MPEIMIRVPKSDLDTLEALMDLYEVSRAEIIRRILREWLDDHEEEINRKVEKKMREDEMEEKDEDDEEKEVSQN